MGEVVQFPKPAPDREQARLIREARSRSKHIPVGKGARQCTA